MKKQKTDGVLNDEILIAALEDHVPLEAMKMICGMSPDDVRKFMKKNLSPRNFVKWRRRVEGSVLKNPKKRPHKA